MNKVKTVMDLSNDEWLSYSSNQAIRHEKYVDTFLEINNRYDAIFPLTPELTRSREKEYNKARKEFTKDIKELNDHYGIGKRVNNVSL